MRRAGDFALLRKQLLKPVVEAADAKRPFPQHTQQLILAKRGNDLLRRMLLLHARQEVLIAQQGIIQHRLILFPGLQRFFLNITEAAVKNGTGRMPIPSVHGRRQLANAGITPETVAFLQQTEAVSQRRRERLTFGYERTSSEAG